MEQLTLQQAMEQLEKIVQELEKGDMEVEQALELYEKAMKLSVYCSEKLSDVKQKFSQLSQAEESTNV